ncbi:hypothetical protein E2562_039183 [Oryza meyeriana var. granulata]|uniref:DUF834 domain-containing protein n=1 Tax=Oryza meyeriana var. granulata TaxID=110450 RepID=A0A6G1DTR3_9ORYZ|nr:hypothetical protein E2562_039183 [Oryza meyeriana var. granulata]
MAAAKPPTSSSLRRHDNDGMDRATGRPDPEGVTAVAVFGGLDLADDDNLATTGAREGSNADGTTRGSEDLATRRQQLWWQDGWRRWQVEGGGRFGSP